MDATTAVKPPPRRGGRPLGSKNKPKDEVMTQEKLNKLYNRVEHMLDEDHRKYLKQVITGKTHIDPVREGELLLRLLSIVVTESLGWALSKQAISRDLAALVGEYRMGIKDLEDMRRRREEQKVKFGTDERMVDPISDAEKRIREDLVGRYTATGSS